MITRNFNLNLNAGHSIPLVINANQYDQGESWVFTLFNSDGTQYTPETGAIVGIKSDGLGIINSGSVVDSKVVITETQQMTASPGKAVFELMIDNGTHGTADFIVLVEEKPGNNADLSDSDLSLIQEALDAVNPLPTGGTVGQVLTKTANGSTWSDAGTPTQEQVAEAVSDWADEHITVETGVVIDTSLAVAGAAADSAKVGQEISDLKSQIALNSGVPTAVKNALDTLFQNVAFKNTDVYTDEIAVVHNWATAVNLISISAVFNQGTNVIYNTDLLETLKQYLTVTASYDNGTSETVSGYTLSGTLVEGTSTITVNYDGKTTAFAVTVTALELTHTYANNQYKAITNPSEMVLTSGMVVSGGNQARNGRVDSTGAAVAGRAADTQRALFGNFGGKTIGLSSYTLSSGSTVAFACWFGKLTNNTWDGTKYVSSNNNYLASAWLTSNTTLPSSSDTNVLLLAFRKGNGSVGDFTPAELAEIPTLFTIS
jgi:hypothetical protein